MLELLTFLRENKDLYRILWYEVSGNQRGFHPVILNDGSWEMSSLYGDTLSEDEYKRILRYRDLLHYVGEQEFTDAELADLIVDRFLYGHAIR